MTAPARLQNLTDAPSRDRQQQSAPVLLVPIRSVSAFHLPDGERLHAIHVAEFFQLSANEMARLLGVTQAAMLCSPTAPVLQNGLIVFERIAAALLVLAGTKEAASAWLNTPDDQLDDLTPLEVIRQGQSQIVAETLEDLLQGQPA